MKITRKRNGNQVKVLKVDGLDFKSIPVEDLGDGKSMSGECGLSAVGKTES